MAFFDYMDMIMGSGYSYPSWFSNAFGSRPAPVSPISTGPVSTGGLYGGDTNYTPPSSAYERINPGEYAFDKKKGASKLSADVIRAQYADYMQRFAPVEDYAVSMLRDRGTADGQYDIARARASVENAAMNLQGQQERAMGRYGLNYGGDMYGSPQVTGGIVGAMNSARFADEERRLALLGGGGGMPQPPQGG